MGNTCHKKALFIASDILASVLVSNTRNMSARATTDICAKSNLFPGIVLAIIKDYLPYYNMQLIPSRSITPDVVMARGSMYVASDKLFVLCQNEINVMQLPSLDFLYTIKHPSIKFGNGMCTSSRFLFVVSPLEDKIHAFRHDGVLAKSIDVNQMGIDNLFGATLVSPDDEAQLIISLVGPPRIVVCDWQEAKTLRNVVLTTRPGYICAVSEDFNQLYLCNYTDRKVNVWRHGESCARAIEIPGEYPYPRDVVLVDHRFLVVLCNYLRPRSPSRLLIYRLPNHELIGNHALNFDPWSIAASENTLFVMEASRTRPFRSIAHVTEPQQSL